MEEWTLQQQNAINSRGRTLLVSAAAGSGKTSVLTRRIITRITDSDDPLDISRILVVTFTRAAAAELKKRIASALDDALAADPHNEKLAGQRLRLGSASISTIDSFCYDLVKKNYSALGLPANLMIIDSAESDVLRSSVRDEVIDEFYTNDKDGVFGNFVNNFVTTDDSSLNDSFIAVYSSLTAFPEGVESINPEKRKVENDGVMPLWQKILCDHARITAEHYIPIFEQALDYIECDEKFIKKFKAIFETLISELRNLRDSCEKGYDAVRSALSFDSAKLSSASCPKTDEIEFYKDMRKDLIKDIRKLRDSDFSYSEEEAAALNERSDRLSEVLYRLLKRFEERFLNEKLRRGRIDFSDVERFSYQLLYDADGNKTQFAAETSACFDEIYIDEYQDVNELQDAIFSAVAKNDNRFMVGDVKQSIYGFRGSNPELFSSYRDAFPLYDENDGNTSGTIFLSDNFRCDRNIIDFTNIVFDTVFNCGNSKISYSEAEKLICSKKADTQKGYPVEVCLVEKPQNKQKKSAPDTDESPAEGGDIDEEKLEAIGEVEYTVKRIQELIDNEGYRPGDIAILLRSNKSQAELFETALKKLNIPSFNATKTSFFENAEILLMLSLLNCIDNPSRDIYLAGTLRSPLFGFTLDELVIIRRTNRDGSLFEALKKYTADNSFKKGEYFLDRLNAYREYASSQSADKLIWYIYRDTSMLSLVYDNDKNSSGARRKNLMLLYDFARKYESNAFRGLYSFICYINDIINNKYNFPINADSDKNDKVQVMSIHNAKGLEFPVVFLCSCSKEFNDNDGKKSMLFTRELGLVSKLTDESGTIKYDPPIREAAVLAQLGNERNEEARILYVALTRAKERLIITGTVDSLAKDIVNEYESAFADEYLISKSKFYMKWILTALARNSQSDCFRITPVPFGFSEAQENIRTAQEERITPDNVLVENIRKSFDYVYPYEYLTKLPAKLSVSKLSPSVLDDDGESDELEKNEVRFTETPSFMVDDNSVSSASGAKHGTATHLFMQFCDFSLTVQNGVEAEIQRLTDRHFIDRATASLINVYQLKKFFGSELFAELSACRKMWRETRFNIRLDAAMFTEDKELRNSLNGESLLVQGVIDCFFITDDDRLVLVDYKTDYIPPEISADREAAEKMLVERHRLQLSYYREACSRIMCRKVDEVLIYSFALGDTVEVKEDAAENETVQK